MLPRRRCELVLLLFAACAGGCAAGKQGDVPPADGLIMSGDGTTIDGVRGDARIDDQRGTPDARPDTKPSPCSGKGCDDKLSCTVDSCIGGLCDFKIKVGYCAISGKCITSKAVSPTNVCQECNTAKSTSAYSPRPDNTACTSDNIACTSDVCKGGACSHPLQTGKCRIGGACYAQAQKNSANACLWCQPGTSTSAWTPMAGGTACPGGKCAGGGCCTGCVSGSGCLPGNTTSSCGKSGNACAPCQTGYTCNAGTCAPPAPLTLNIGPYGSTYSDTGHTRGYWFTAPINFTIVGLRVPTDVGTQVQNVQVLRLSTVPPTSTYTSLFYQKGVAGTGFITTNIPVNKNDVIGVLGARGTTTMNSSYAAAYTYTTTLGGQSILLQRLMLQSNINQGPATGSVTSNAHYYSRVEMRYLPY